MSFFANVTSNSNFVLYKDRNCPEKPGMQKHTKLERKKSFRTH